MTRLWRAVPGLVATRSALLTAQKQTGVGLVRCFSIGQQPSNRANIPVLPYLVQSRALTAVAANQSSARAPQPAASQSKEATNGPLERAQPFEKNTALRPEIRNGLAELSVVYPTAIQKEALGPILKGSNVLCAAETGSGKTLAYLMPILSQLRQEEVDGFVARIRRPRAVVLLPSQELALQVMRVAKSLSHEGQFRTLGLFNSQKLKVINTTLLQPVDLLVATPNRLLSALECGNLHLTDVRFVVVDEADTLFDDTFFPTVADIIKPVLARQPPSDGGPIRPFQLVAATATVTRPLVDRLNELVPDLQQVSTLALHRSLATVRQRFVHTTIHRDEKKQKLLELVGRLRGQSSAMVFCNTTSCCDWLAALLAEGGHPNIKLHGNLDPKERALRFQQFQDKPGQLLVCTDVASRGLDTLSVDHVINFDFPPSVADYLHRAGRTGRLGREGTVTSLYTQREKHMAERIETAVTKDRTLGGLFKEITQATKPRPQQRTLSAAFKVPKPPGQPKAPYKARASANQNAPSRGRNSRPSNQAPGKDQHSRPNQKRRSSSR